MSAADTRPEDQRIDMGALLGALLSRWLRILVVTLAALGITYGVLMFVPRMYESSAGLLVEQRTSPATSAIGGQSAGPSIPVEAMMSSQIELIKSRDTLLQVIDSENLRSEPEFTGAGFSPISFVMGFIRPTTQSRSLDETVLGNLNERLTVVRERDSAVISINVRSEDPDLAARIANAIADAHVKRRTALSLSDTAEATAWLEQEIARLRVRVEEADRAVAEYRVANDLFTGTDNTSILDQQLTAISAQITEAQERKNAAQSRASLIRELLAQGRSIDGVTDVGNSPTIQQLTQTRATLQGQLAERSATLLDQHPTIRALRAQIADIERQIAAEARRVADALEAEAAIEGNLEASLRDDLARQKQTVSNATRDGVTLDSLMREAKAQRDLLESYLLRYSDAASRTDAGSALPDVRQITLAAPSVQPASPKTTLILAAVGLAVFALQLGATLFGELMSGRALTDRNAYRPIRDEDLDAMETEEDPAQGDLFDQPPANDDVFEYAGAGAPEPDAYEDAAGDAPDWPEEPVAYPASDGDARPLPVHGDPFTAAVAAAVASPPPPVPPALAVETTAAPEPAYDDAPVEDEEPAPPLAATPAGLAASTSVDPSVGENALELSNLSADIAIGRVRVVMLAALKSNDDCELVADKLIDDALKRGLSVVLVDAGSGRMSSELGLTDLSTERASFGDVVHRVREGLAEVPWGQEAALERRSSRPLTLVEALTDIYEVVIVMTGKIGMASALPVFSGLPCRLVLVGPPHPARETVEAAVEDAANLGYDVGQIVHPPQLQVA